MDFSLLTPIKKRKKRDYFTSTSKYARSPIHRSPETMRTDMRSKIVFFTVKPFKVVK